MSERDSFNGTTGADFVAARNSAVGMLDAATTAVLAWGDSADLWFHRHAAGSGWGPAELVESNAGEINGPRVAIGANNSAIAAWSQDDATGVSDIWVNINL